MRNIYADEWVKAVKKAGYTAAVCPISTDSDAATVSAYADAAHWAGIVIAEVGAWGHNPISPNPQTRQEGLAGCQQALALADEIGARCCVNIAGSRGVFWDGPHEDNLTQATFDFIVETVRKIIDAVKPRRTFYTLEMMPWAYPDDADTYLALIKAINRQQFAVHLDPVNIINSPRLYYNNGAMLRECFQKLGPYIKNCHAKDIVLRDQLTVHLDEVRPGLGKLDYMTYLHELNKLDPDIGLIVEHLEEEEEYTAAANHIRGVAQQIGVPLL